MTTTNTQFPETINKAIESAMKHRDELCNGYVVVALKGDSDISMGDRFNLFRDAIAQIYSEDRKAARILRKACRRVHRSSKAFLMM